MRALPVLLALSVLAVLPACDGNDDESRHRSHHHGYTVSAEGGAIYVKKNDLVIRSDKADLAVIHPDASLTIDGENVPVTEPARKALNGYRAAYKAVAEHAIGLGIDGVNLGLDTMREVFKGLLDGTADEAGKEADRRGKELDARARLLCDKLSALRDSQQQVLALVPKFADYAVIQENEVKDCFDDNQKAVAETREEARADAADDDDKVDLTGATKAMPPTPATPATPATPKSRSGMSYNINVDSGDWSVRKGKVVVVSLDGGDDAFVGRDGSLHIGDDPIDVSDAGRSALKRFHDTGLKVENEGAGPGLAGVDIALGAVGSAIHGALGGDGDTDQRDLQRKGEAMNERVKRMCGDLREMRSAQEDAVAAVPKFKSYAVITEKGVRNCGINKHSPKDKDDSPAT